MIIVIERISTLILGGILIFNMTARRHLEEGSKKRTASLLLAVCFLVFYLGVLAIKQNNMPLSLLYPLSAISFMLIIILRRKIFIFRRYCRICGDRLSWKEILYIDNPPCRKCIDLDRKNCQSVPERVSEIDWENWEPTEKAVICYIVDEKNRKVLLINKKTGLGTGKVNAPGGRLEKGESFPEAAVRECQEEVNLIPKNLEKRMELNFQFTNGYALYGEAYFAYEWEGEPAESDEAEPFWCDMDSIPWEKMWEDDINWLPRAFEGKKQRGRYIFDEDQMLGEELETLEEF